VNITTVTFSNIGNLTFAITKSPFGIARFSLQEKKPQITNIVRKQVFIWLYILRYFFAEKIKITPFKFSLHLFC
jgi:hypothetical protein